MQFVEKEGVTRQQHKELQPVLDFSQTRVERVDMRAVRTTALFFLRLTVLAGCTGGCGGSAPLITDPVIITYRQIYNFRAWEVKTTDGSIISNGTLNDGVYMRYRIVSIDNRASNSTIFHFNPNRIYYSSNSIERPVNPVIGLSGMLAFDVPSHSLHANQHNVTIKLDGNLGETKNQVEFLNYQSEASDHVIMANEDSEMPSVPFRPVLQMPGDNAN